MSPVCSGNKDGIADLASEPKVQECLPGPGMGGELGWPLSLKSGLGQLGTPAQLGWEWGVVPNFWKEVLLPITGVSQSL